MKTHVTPEKNQLEWDSNLSYLQYQCSAQPTELSSQLPSHYVRAQAVIKIKPEENSAVNWIQAHDPLQY